MKTSHMARVVNSDDAMSFKQILAEKPLDVRMSQQLAFHTEYAPNLKMTNGRKSSDEKIRH